ncbi:hypothetical protein ABZ330_00985 [Streptomyces sp. NPDC006172]|uniref:hypothetical protein n=1 Tax=Streptomyces sp. NPDC006172 TaxID=3154470 RepID=UPI0033DEAB9D
MSTDQQSADRQNLVLAQPGIEKPVVFEEDPGTSSRLHCFVPSRRHRETPDSNIAATTTVSSPTYAQA